MLGMNQLSGSIAESCYKGRLGSLDVSENMLTGFLPEALFVNTLLTMLDFSGNALEGSFPPVHHFRKLQLLDVSGVAGAGAHMRGPLPPQSAA